MEPKRMYKGVIVENSLVDAKVLRKLKVDKSYKSGDWMLHEVHVAEEQLPQFKMFIADGPWYAHFWSEWDDDVKVVFKDRMFDIRYSDKSTWRDAVKYGESIGIPSRQLDFAID